MVAVYLGAPSPLATQIGVGRRVRRPNKRRANLTLDKSGFALILYTGGPRAPRIHHPPIRGAPTTTPLRTSSKATPVGLASKDAPRYGAYSRASYPPQTPAASVASAGTGKRDCLVPDALLRRSTEPDAV